MGTLIIFIIIIMFLAGIGSNSNNQESPKKPDKPSNEKQVIIKKNGQQKRYKINQYGEIFED